MQLLNPRRRLAFVLVLLLASALRAADTAYLFTYFTGNGEDGLHLAWSEDGYRWTALDRGRSFLFPQVGKDRLMRDPCVTRGPDGTYHLVWTSGWWDNAIGYASTRDFLTWSEQKAIPVMAHEPTVRNSWAPEVAWDAQRAQFLVFWASTIPGKFPETAGSSEDALNHRIYATATKDWQTFTPTRLFVEPGFNVIDATLLPRDGGWWMIAKDETQKPPKKHLRLAHAEDIKGPWREFGAPFTRDWVEGPTAICVGEDVMVYFDVYRERHYGALRSRDLKTWEDVTDRIALPAGARHGTMIEVPRALIDRLRAAKPEVEHLVRFDAPANHFTAATPLGNGRLGMMPFGGMDEERVVLNEAGMWSGSPQDADRPNAAAALPEIRRLLLAGKNAEAEKVVAENFTCAGAGSGHGRGANEPYGSYQVLGDLWLRFEYSGAAAGSRSQNAGERPALPANYHRELDIADAVSRVSYERDGVRFEREAFVSAPDEVGVIRLTASKRGAISFDLALDRPERATVRALEGGTLLMSGRLNDGKGAENVGFATVARIVNRGGSVEPGEGVLRVRDADEVLVLVTAATDIKSFAGRKVDDAVAAATADMDRIAKKSYGALRAAHLAHYRGLFDRVMLRLAAATGAEVGRTVPGEPGSTGATLVADDATTASHPQRLGRDASPYQRAPDCGPTTQQRLEAQAAGTSDPGLAQLYFDFGRYLLISSTRPEGFPPNLQGIWADGVQTPWNGDWHLNINVQMNFWPAEVCGLSELHEPMFAFTRSLTEPGARTAQKYYGARGWVAHVLANPWGFTSPGEGASWGATTTGSAWLCQHLWDRYLFTGDRAFLERAYPLMKGSARFYLDMLIEEPKHGWLVTAPANSPENEFVMSDGTKAHVCLGPTFDNQILRYLFAATAEAARVLGVDAELQRELGEKAARLPPTQIGPDGRVMEWLENYGEADPHHRHISHLWGLYPGDEISVTGTPELAAAARKTLDARGDGGTGWALAHKLTLWARLHDGARASDLLRSLLKPAIGTDRITTTGGGTYPNLFDAHPPFQIDGNFGGTAAIAELLLQSRAQRPRRKDVTGVTPNRLREEAGWEIEVLPALPPGWREGEVRGLRARGGFVVDLRWQAGVLDRVCIRSLRGEPVTVRHGNRAAKLALAAGQSIALDGDLQPATP